MVKSRLIYKTMRSRKKTMNLLLIGRDGVIRTHDPLHPMQVRYQAALRPDKKLLYQFEFLAIEL